MQIYLDLMHIYKKRRDLELLMNEKGMCTFWFTCSASDNHCLYFHSLIYGSIDLPSHSSEALDAHWRRKIRTQNPHIVDAFFHERMEIMLDILFGADGMETEWIWYRIEYQKRGATHKHGCIIIKCDPGITLHADNVLKGNMFYFLIHFYSVLAILHTSLESRSTRTHFSSSGGCWNIDCLEPFSYMPTALHILFFFRDYFGKSCY